MGDSSRPGKMKKGFSPRNCLAFGARDPPARLVTLFNLARTKGSSTPGMSKNGSIQSGNCAGSDDALSVMGGKLSRSIRWKVRATESNSTVTSAAENLKGGILTVNDRLLTFSQRRRATCQMDASTSSSTALLILAPLPCKLPVTSAYFSHLRFLASAL